MMSLRRPSARATLTILFVLIGATWGGFLGLRHLAARASALDGLENLSLDWRYSLAGPRTPPRGVVIAAIDEETIRQAGAFPLPRGVLAQIVRGIARHNPQVICVDVLLLDPGNAEVDRELADALHAGRSVIGAVALFGHDDAGEVAATGPGEALIPMPTRILWPQEIFRAAAQPGSSLLCLLLPQPKGCTGWIDDNRERAFGHHFHHVLHNRRTKGFRLFGCRDDVVDLDIR